MRFAFDSTMRAARFAGLGFGLCSLREAIIAANTHAASGAIIGECPAGTGGDTTNLPAGTCSLAIPAAGGNDATSGDLNITGTVTTIGTGNPTVRGGVGWADGIFDIADTATVSMSGFTITGGNRNIDVSVDGGGGIRALGPLTLTAMTITANAATHSGTGLAPGAGIYTQGSLTMTGSTVSGNKAIGTMSLADKGITNMQLTKALPAP